MSGITCITFARSLRKGCVLLLASADAEGGIIVWALDLTGGLLESHRLDGHSNRVVAMQFYSSGRKLITSSVDTKICIWNVATGKLAAWLDGHKRAVTGMDCMSLRGAVAVATCSVHGTWYLWDLKLRRHIRTGHVAGAAGIVRFSPYIHAMSPPRPLLVTAHWSAVRREASLHLWDVFDPNAGSGTTVPWHSFSGVARGQIQDIAFTVDQVLKPLMAVAALDGSLIIYDLFARSVLTHMVDGHISAEGALACLVHPFRLWTPQTLSR
jgi:WD40 repeat protein